MKATNGLVAALAMLLLAGGALGASPAVQFTLVELPTSLHQGDRVQINWTARNLASDPITVFYVLNISTAATVVEAGEFNVSGLSELQPGLFSTGNITLAGSSLNTYSEVLKVNTAADPDQYLFNLSIMTDSDFLVFVEQLPPPPLPEGTSVIAPGSRSGRGSSASDRLLSTGNYVIVPKNITLKPDENGSIVVTNIRNWSPYAEPEPTPGGVEPGVSRELGSQAGHGSTKGPEASTLILAEDAERDQGLLIAGLGLLIFGLGTVFAYWKYRHVGKVKKAKKEVSYDE